MKYLISYRQQLKITPAPPPAAAGLAFVSGVVGRGASRPSAQSFAAPRVCTTQKAPPFLAKGSRCELKRTAGQAAGKSAAGFLSN
jgi:hypothetical protein